MSIKNLATLSAEALRGAVTMGETVSAWIEQIEREIMSGEARLAVSQLGDRLAEAMDLAEILIELDLECDAAPAAPATFTPAEQQLEGLADAVAESLEPAPPDLAAIVSHARQNAEAIAATLATYQPTPWSPERRELLRQLYPTRMGIAEIREHLALLPGEALPNADAVRAYAIQCLHLRRSGAPIPPHLPRLSPAEPPASATIPERTYTAARLALLRRLYPTTMRLREIWQRMSELPGPNLRSPEALRKKAEKLGLLRMRLPIPAEFLPAAETPADSAPQRPAEDPAPAAGIPAARPAGGWRTDWPFPAEDLPEAIAMIRAGSGARDLTEEFGWNLADAQAFAAQTRAQQALEQKAAA